MREKDKTLEDDYVNTTNRGGGPYRMELKELRDLLDNIMFDDPDMRYAVLDNPKFELKATMPDGSKSIKFNCDDVSKKLAKTETKYSSWT